MKKTQITIILFCFAIFTKNYSQNLFLINNNKEIFQLNSGNSLSLVKTINYSNNFITDIAISSNDIFYGVTGDNKIIEINIQTGGFTILSNLVNSGIYTSLVCSNNNELYTLNTNNELYKYDITTGILSLIDNIGFHTPGDLTFFKGNLIFKDYNSEAIKAYNISNNNIIDIFCLPNGNNDFLGISNIFSTCESNTIVGSANNSLYEIDFENNELIDLNIDLN